MPVTDSRRSAGAALRQIEANRLNALKSTGPKTEDGKQRSRRNALRHGFLSALLRVNFWENQRRRTRGTAARAFCFWQNETKGWPGHQGCSLRRTHFAKRSHFG